MAETPRVAIVGAGIGGLAAAIALHRAGVHVQVYEQVRHFERVGAGLQLAPNATAALAGLGLLPATRRSATAPRAWHSYDAHTGALDRAEPLGDAVADHFGSPYLHIHRGDLHALLAEAAREHVVVHQNKQLTGLDADAGGVRLGFTEGPPVHVDAVIGADGIRSTVREILWGHEEPRFAGMVAYRGLISADRVDDLGVPHVAAKWWASDRHLVHYWVSGGRELNYVAPVPAADWAEESWLAKGSVADLIEALGDFAPEVPRLVARGETVFRSALYDRDPLRRWTLDAVTLLGDAAHPMLPFMAQGAAMAIEDAVVLARCLHGASVEHLPAALARYERARIARTTAMQDVSRANTFLRNDNPDTATLPVEEVYRYDPWTVDLPGQ